MSEEPFGFAPPPFKPEEALQRLQRELRGFQLEAREAAFERRGLKIARATLVDGRLQASIANAPARSPTWQDYTIGNGAELRDFVSELKKRIAGWSDRED